MFFFYAALTVGGQIKLYCVLKTYAINPLLRNVVKWSATF